MNFVFFFPDEMRAQSLACYGNSKIKTPNYDALANEAVLFEQCHVQNTVCSPSRCCLVTGQYVHCHGHRSLWNLVKPHEKNLFRYFKEADYQVRIYGKNDLYSPESVKLCTDEFKRYSGLCKDHSKSVYDYGTAGFYDFLYSPLQGKYSDHHDYQDLLAAMDFIKNWKEGDKPFVLFLPLALPHCPYTAHEPFYSMYSENDCEKRKPQGTNKPKFHKAIRDYRNLSNSNFDKINAVYMGMISFADKLLGELLECIKQSNIENQTMIIASSDHGDYAGDYDLVEKWPSGMEDVLTRVPLIIKSPNCKKGHRVKELVELFDIFPTMMETANIDICHTHFAKSLVKQLNGEHGDPNRAVFCEGGYNENEPHCNEGQSGEGTAFMLDKKAIYYPKGLMQKEVPQTVCRATMIRTMSHKLVKRSDGDNELYQLSNDKDELCNLYGQSEFKDIQQQLEERMLDWYIATSDAVAFEKDPRGI